MLFRSVYFFMIKLLIIYVNPLITANVVEICSIFQVVFCQLDEVKF